MNANPNHRHAPGRHAIPVGAPDAAPIVAPVVAPIIAPVVAIDGPVASGKTSVGRAAARRLALRFLDTGIMYRAVTWLALKRNIPIANANAIGNLAQSCHLTLVDDATAAADDAIATDTIAIDGRPLAAAELQSPAVVQNVSAVSAISPVRHALVQQQRQIATDAAAGIIMAGRDIGSVVLPDADLKLYIDAAPETRARRRLAQIPSADNRHPPDYTPPDYARVLADTIRRDALDSSRADSPLTIHPGAIVISTDHMTLDETVAAVISAITTATRQR